ncbi:Phosphatidylglycerol/phosphatidylinositol transfer protein [Puttea exsequens]|nr:Phosphatidylglycerol/phosphatidylinositol transfer protein [Puttea exsequens]
MRFMTILSPLILGLLASRVSASFFSSNQKILDDKASVPGDNPLVFCLADTSNDILKIENVDLSPNPPRAGEALSIKANGNFTEVVGEGAYILLQVKYGLIRLINQRADLCEQMKNVDEECPLSGQKTITKDVELPKEIPPGNYQVFADVLTKDDKKITCLEAKVHFGK